MYHVLELLELFNAVVDKEDLTVTRELKVDGFGDDVVVEGAHCGEDGIAVGGRCGQGAQVAGAHQRELQRARDGRGAHRQRVDVDLHLLEFVLDGDAKLLLLIDDQQAQVMELHRLADEFVGADEDVDFALLEVGEQLLYFLRFAGTAQVVHPHWEVVQTLAEGAIVLECQHSRRHEYGGLLAVDGSLKGGADGNLGLAEAHVTADEAVHRLAALHIGFDGLGSGQLVGRVLIDERGLQLLLQVAVGRVGKALLLATCGIQADEFAGDILQAALGAGFDFCPRVAAQAVQPGRLTVLTAVFREFVQRVDGNVCLITVQVGEFNHLLRRAVHVDAQQAAEFAHTQVLMNDIVAFLDLVEFLEREGEFARACAVALEVVLVETVKYLVVGEDTELQVIVNKAFMQRPEYRFKGNIITTVLKDVVQAFNLLDTVAQDDEPVATG